ncbi:glycosyltransferase [Escherichia coli]|nr:glycosyltransferase [Escherichia coli]
MSLYDKEKPEYLDQCLNSLSRQTLLADEIVMVYDGPINIHLESVVDKWSRLLPIKIVKLEKNVGLGKALNEGLINCTFDIVARMDTDDICNEKRFEKQINMFARDDELSILGSYIEEFEGTEKNIISVRHVPQTYNEILNTIKLKNPFNHMTVMFKKKAILSVGGYQKHHLMEDYNLWLRLISKGYKGLNIPENLVSVRAGRDMIARRHGVKYIGSELKLAKLKMELGYLGVTRSIYIFILRSLPRLMPIFILKEIYKIARVK